MARPIDPNHQFVWKFFSILLNLHPSYSLYSLELQNGVYGNLVECNCTLMYCTTYVVECCIVATIGRKTFKSSILIFKVQKCHNGNFSILPNGTFEPVHKIWNVFWPKVFFWSNIKMTERKSFHNMSQGPLNPGFMQEKSTKRGLSKKALFRCNSVPPEFSTQNDMAANAICFCFCFCRQKNSCWLFADTASLGIELMINKFHGVIALWWLCVSL